MLLSQLLNFFKAYKVTSTVKRIWMFGELAAPNPNLDGLSFGTGGAGGGGYCAQRSRVASHGNLPSGV